MEAAAKLKEDEIRKEKELRLMQIKMERVPIDKLELQRHQDKIDRQIAEA